MIDSGVRKDFSDSGIDVRYVKGIPLDYFQNDSGEFALRISKAGFIYPVDGGSFFIRSVSHTVIILFVGNDGFFKKLFSSLDRSREYLFRLVRDDSNSNLVCSKIHSWY